MQNSINNTKSKNTTKKNSDGDNMKTKTSNTKKDTKNNGNNKENIPSNSERRNSKHSNAPKNKSNSDNNTNNNNNNKNVKQTHNTKGGKATNDDHNKKGNNLSKKKSKQNLGLNKKASFSNSHNKKSNRKNSSGDNIILKVPQPTEVFDKSVDSVCVSKLPTYINGQMVDNGIDKYVTLIKQSLTDHEKVKLVGVEPALALTISIILILEEQKAIRKPVILTRTMEDKNKNLKSGIITELYPNTNKGIH
ncbi:hypothetical protein PIROE2DRAFT_18737 [Piromyces sp. E2]|nr:hypothetical protein PIROE2DRAFT_18737 [Piromyces sp. E2]|eukprot:OUM56590.1 hypothetical protein PIROE2DRAFT_18737 [Piromyces sp. E2]